MYARIINLAHRTDRWDQVQPFIQSSKHSIERFNAIKVKREDASLFLSSRARADFMKPMRYQHETIFGVGAIGCALSHLAIWREFLASNASHAVILEDDIDPKYASTLDSRIAEMQGDIFMLGWMGKPTLKSDGSILTYPSGRMIWGTHAYIVNRRAAETLCIHAFPLEMQADYMLQCIADQYNLTVRCASSPIKQKYTGTWDNIMGSNIFSVCLFCDPSNVYYAFGALFLLVVFLYLR